MNEQAIRALLLTGDSTSRLTEVLAPAPSENEAVVRVTMSAVCGSDLPHYCKPVGKLGSRATTVPGHEAVGFVEHAAIDGSGPAEGTRVIV